MCWAKFSASTDVNHGRDLAGLLKIIYGANSFVGEHECERLELKYFDSSYFRSIILPHNRASFPKKL